MRTVVAFVLVLVGILLTAVGFGVMAFGALLGAGGAAFGAMGGGGVLVVGLLLTGQGCILDALNQIERRNRPAKA